MRKWLALHSREGSDFSYPLALHCSYLKFCIPFCLCWIVVGVCVCVCMCVCVCVTSIGLSHQKMCVYVCMCLNVCVCVYVLTCVCVCVTSTGLSQQKVYDQGWEFSHLLCRLQGHPDHLWGVEPEHQGQLWEGFLHQQGNGLHRRASSTYDCAPRHVQRLPERHTKVGWLPAATQLLRGHGGGEQHFFLFFCWMIFFLRKYILLGFAFRLVNW